ncbi:DUF1456 family protein [Leuconostocaceae bacterium ESL0958]|nr:DUF1456 family protein [Leuconostocaceae bacterium ESL0958]
MNNNDIIIRLRYALSLSNAALLKIAAKGGLDLDTATLDQILTKQAPETATDANLSNQDLEKFLNGLIIDRRGPQKDRAGQIIPPSMDIEQQALVNNVTIKKIKIAMGYTSTDLQELLALAGDRISNGELSAILRRPDHRNYRQAGDRYLRKLLAGMAKRYRQ